MLRLAGEQVESLFDQLLPVEVRQLPADLAVLDRLLADPWLLVPIEQAWEHSARRHGRPTIPMASFVRLMVIKQRTGWGTRPWFGRCRTRCTCAGSVCCR
jgi:transposase, IS5 family